VWLILYVKVSHPKVVSMPLGLAAGSAEALMSVGQKVLARSLGGSGGVAGSARAAVNGVPVPVEDQVMGLDRWVEPNEKGKEAGGEGHARIPR
jgi:hypothetical protein